ncbi:hypothetical protein ACFVJK_30645 [Streptomyces sp. NPDC127172]|uniref:hypothetical protein n=1 Tax=Streptomyces sp. NPDC127172 TaxID=3345382 RepID=UPI0036408064
MTWHEQLLVRVNDRYDRENASDGVSRYGAYLRQNLGLFRDGWSDEPAPIKNPAEYAIYAWQVATGPIMYPGYVQFRPDLNRVSLHRTDEDGSLYADVHIPLRHSHIGGNTKRFPYSWQDWETEPDYSSDEYRGLQEPRFNKKPSVLASAVVRIPGGEWTHLISPTAYEGRTLVDEARDAVAVVAQLINEDAGPIVARVLDERRGL